MTYCIRILLPPSPLFHKEKRSSVVKSFKLTRKFQQISGFLLNTSERQFFFQNIIGGGGGGVWGNCPPAPPLATALHPVQITGMSIKNVKALFWILNHCNCINSSGYQTTIAVKQKIWKHFCQRILKRHVCIWLFEVMNWSNFLLMSILLCIIYWKLKRRMEHK